MRPLTPQGRLTKVTGARESLTRAAEALRDVGELGKARRVEEIAQAVEAMEERLCAEVLGPAHGSLV